MSKVKLTEKFVSKLSADNWDIRTIDEIGNIITGNTPSSSIVEYYAFGNRLWVSPADLGQNKYIYDTQTKLSDLGFTKTRKLRPYTILVTCIGSTIGKIAIATTEMSTNQQINSVECYDGYNPDFYYYVLLCMADDFKLMSSNQAIPILNKTDFSKFKVPAPKLLEQKAISSVLTNIDNAMEKTEQIIDKYKNIKTGMMQDLFARGLDENGKLRPTYEQAPELYKLSELGWIPKEWEVKILDDMGKFQNGINANKDAFGKGSLFVNISDAYHEKLNCSGLGRVEVPKNLLNSYKLEIGDILFVRSSVKWEGVAYPTLFNGFKEFVAFCGFMIRFRLNDKDNNIPEYFNDYLRNYEFRRRVLALATVSANTNINQESLKSLSVKIPPKAEQFEIHLRIEQFNKKIEEEELYLEKLKQIKQGLMQDLLTGKVRVKLEQEAVA